MTRLRQLYCLYEPIHAGTGAEPFIPAMRFISSTSALQLNDLAGSANGDAVGVEEVLSRVPTLHGPQNFFEYVLQHLLVEAQVSHELFEMLVFLP